VHDRPPSHQKRIARRRFVGHMPTCLPALSCVCRSRWSIMALFGTMGPENKNERSRGISNLSAASPPTLAKEKAPIQHTGSPCPGDHPSHSHSLPSAPRYFSDVYSKPYNIAQPSRCQGQIDPKRPPRWSNVRGAHTDLAWAPRSSRTTVSSLTALWPPKPARATRQPDCSSSPILLAGLTQPGRSRLRKI